MPARAAGPLKRSRRLADMIPIDQPLDPPKIIIDRDKIIQADHLHLTSRLTRPDRKRRKSHTHRLPAAPDETSTGS